MFPISRITTNTDIHHVTSVQLFWSDIMKSCLAKIFALQDDSPAAPVMEYTGVQVLGFSCGYWIRFVTSLKHKLIVNDFKSLLKVISKCCHLETIVSGLMIQFCKVIVYVQAMIASILSVYMCEDRGIASKAEQNYSGEIQMLFNDCCGLWWLLICNFFCVKGTSFVFMELNPVHFKLHQTLKEVLSLNIISVLNRK